MSSVSRARRAIRSPRHCAHLLRFATACGVAAFLALSGGCSGADSGTGIIPGDSTVIGNGGGGGTTGGGGSNLVPPQTIDAFGQSVVDEINKERRKVGLDTVAVDGRLVAAAQLQANQIVQTGVYAHSIPGSKYPTPANRVDATGFPWSAIAENLAQSQTTAKTVVDGWMASTAERANMLSATLVRAGVAESWATSGTQYTVLVLATPK